MGVQCPEFVSEEKVEEGNVPPEFEVVEDIDFEACETSFEDQEKEDQEKEDCSVTGSRDEGRAVERLEGGSVLNVSGSSLGEQIGSIDPRLVGFLHNLQNSGNVTINFHFDSKQK